MESQSRNFMAQPVVGLASALADNHLFKNSNDHLFKNSNDQFTAKMFQEMVKVNEGKSVILSAFSVLPPLAQLALASTGPSHDELLAAIGLPNDETTKEVFSNLNHQINAIKGLELIKASRMYIAKEAKLKKKFSALSSVIFNSDYINIDFSNSVQSAQTINNWVELQTRGKIKNVLSTVDPATRSILVNAIYFKGIWKNKFIKDNTRPKDFHVSKSKTVKVPTMQNTNIFKYGESSELNAKLLELPYEGDEASFLVVLPNEIDGLNRLEKNLKDPSVLNKAIGDMSKNRVQLSMPKFKIETKTDLKNVLIKMNVTKLFDPSQARLDKLFKSKSHIMSISSAIQKTFIEVTEEGTEAAAANAFFLLLSAKPEDNYEIINFKVNRPFYFEIRLKNTALFNGVVVNL